MAEERWGRTWGEKGETSDIKLIYKKRGHSILLSEMEKKCFFIAK